MERAAGSQPAAVVSRAAQAAGGKPKEKQPAGVQYTIDIATSWPVDPFGEQSAHATVTSASENTATTAREVSGPERRVPTGFRTEDKDHEC